MSTDTTRQSPSFAYYAGRASCFIFAIVYGLGRIFGGPNRIPDWAALSLIGLGLVLAIVAIRGSRNDPERSILGPALAGILLNGLLLSAFVGNFIKARAQERPAAAVEKKSSAPLQVPQ